MNTVLKGLINGMTSTSLNISVCLSVSLSRALSICLSLCVCLSFVSLDVTWCEVNNSCQMAEVSSCRTLCSNSPNKDISCLTVSSFLMTDIKATLQQHFSSFSDFCLFLLSDIQLMICCCVEAYRYRLTRTWVNVFCRSWRITTSSSVLNQSEHRSVGSRWVMRLLSALWDDCEKMSVFAETSCVTQRKSGGGRNVVFNIHVFV